MTLACTGCSKPAKFQRQSSGLCGVGAKANEWMHMIRQHKSMKDGCSIIVKPSKMQVEEQVMARQCQCTQHNARQQPAPQLEKQQRQQLKGCCKGQRLLHISNGIVPADGKLCEH